MQALALTAGIVVGVIAVLLHVLVWRGRLGSAGDRRPDASVGSGPSERARRTGADRR
jgi:hypothetical protein